MIKKSILIIIMLLCLGMLISTVSASEVNETVEIEALSVSGDMQFFNETLSADESDFTTLASDINNGGSSIKLTKDYAMQAGETHVVITKSNIVIDGQGHTLNANTRGNIFGVTGSNIVFKNITFINGLGVNGGAIDDFYGDGKSYTVIDCTFINNTATNCGGALYAQYSPFYVYNSTFINNRNNGNYGGGAIFSDRNIYVDGCTFQGNTIAKSSGSAIKSSRGLASVSNSVFTQTQFGFSCIGAATYNVTDSYSSFTDLNNLISESNGELVLEYDYKYMPEIDNGGITVSKEMIINGNGHNIDAGGNAMCIFKVTGDNVVLKNVNITNGYIYEVNDIGVAVSWSGSNGLLDNVVIKNCTFDSVRNAGSYNWWNSGMVYWNGENGTVNNVRFLSDKVVSSKGIIIWLGSNGVVNNSYFNDCSNMYNGYVGYSQAASFFIYWNADNGKFLNSRVENLKINLRQVPNPCYVSFTKPGYVGNVSFINCQHSNSGQTVADLDMPFSPLEDYVWDFTGTLVKQTPTIDVSDVVDQDLLIISVNAVRSGSVTYSIDDGSSHTVNVDNNGKVAIDVSALSDGEHKITYSYSGNSFYNSVSAASTNFVYSSYSPELVFTEVKITNNQYNYSFILHLKDGRNNYVNDVAVSYNIVLANGNAMTLQGMSNTVYNFYNSVPLLNLTASFNGIEVEPVYYPLKALEMLIENANDGDTINLVHDYILQSGDSPITISKKNFVIDGQGHTINANGSSLFSVTGENVVLKNMNLINGYVKNINNKGVIISWSGTGGLLDNVIIKNSTFDSQGSAGSYQWWNSGIVYWNGKNGVINNLKLLCCTVVSSRGFVIWSGANGVINNSYFADCTNAYNSGVGQSQATSFFIYWNAANGKFLNSRVENLQLGVRNVDNPYYMTFTKAGYVENVSFINCQHSNRGQTVYDLKMPVDSIENYVVDFNGTVNRKTPTITLDNDVFSVSIARSGVITYYVDDSEAKTTFVDKNGHFSLDYDFSSQKNYLVKIIYNENQFYNEVLEYFDYNSNGITDSFGSFTDLNNLILSSSGSVINLYKNYIYDPIKDAALTNGIVISKSITINGNDHYIDADYNPIRIFTTNANVVLNNIAFKNSRLNGAGNAILANSPININNCTFDNNWASNCFGAAINLKGDNSNITYCTFTNNKAKTGSAIVVNSKNNHIQYSYFKDNSKDYGGAMNYVSDISVSGGCTAYVNYNIFLDDRPLRQISGEYCRDNWYGSNSLPDSIASGAPSIPNYLKASLEYTLNNNVLTVGIKFSESDTGNAVDIPWSRVVPYTVSSSTIIGDNLNKVTFTGVTGAFTLNAVIDNQRLTVTNGNSWYVDGSVTASGSGTQNSPFKTLREAINNAVAGDTIYIAPGTYSGLNNVKLTINKALTLERWGDSGEVIFDGQNMNYIFTLNSNVVLSSLTFQNGKNGNGGALTIKSNSLIIDCLFKDNQASSWGGAIDMNPGSATIVNSQFINNNAPSGGGAISMAAVNLTVINSIFTNNYGGRGGAINDGNTEADLYVIGSTFKDNTAATYGGALIFDGTGNIDESTFINNTALLGGGAVLMWDYHHSITNSKFINNTASDGGAIIFVLSNMTLKNDYFENNNALEFGGAIYSFGNLEVIGGYFTKNQAYYDGGAVYIYKGVNIIYEGLFKSNIAGYGGGAVHSLASDLSFMRSCMMNNISSVLNGYINTIYLNSFIDFGNYTLVVADTSNYNGTLPSRFSLVENRWDTAVKNQGSLGICWDYSVIGSVETAIKKATGMEFDLSENNVKNLISRYSIYGNGREPNGGGYQWDASSYLANSLGPVLESYDPTGSFGFSPIISNAVHVSNIAYAHRDRSAPLANDEVKEAVIKYGGVRASILMGSPKGGYNYYENSSTGTNHAILIVGWDDNYAASNFPGNCPGDGAWIVKNSWGPNSGDGGYIYVSYYDTSFAWSTLTYIIFNDTIRYSRVYQYDYYAYGWMGSGGSDSWYKNTYTSVKNEGLTAFSTYFDGKKDWEVFVYVGDELKHTQTGSSIGQGYFTFNFDKIVPVAEGEEFTVVLKVNYGNFPVVSKTLNTIPCGEGVSYYSKDGTTWTDLNSKNNVACLKVFTQNLPGSLITINPIVNVTYSNLVSIDFAVENRTTVNCIVKNRNGDMIVSMVNVNGDSITLSGLGAGDYTITIINNNTDEYIGDSKSANFTVLKANSSVSISTIQSVYYGNTINVDFSVVNSTTVTYTVKTLNEEVVVANTSASSLNKITVPVLNAGEYVITIANSENDNYTGDVASLAFTILKVTPIVSVSADDVIYSKDVVVNVVSDIAGNYIVKIQNISLNVVLKADETKNITFNNLDAGNYVVIVDFNETTNYNNVTKNTTVRVLKASSKVTINTIEDVTYSNNVNVGYNVANKTSLIVKVIDKNSGQTITIPNNNITDTNIVIGGLNAGDYSITINNTGDDNYNSSYASKDFKINKYTPSINVNTSNIIYSNNLIVSVLSDVSGVFTVKIANKTQNVTLIANILNNVAFSGLNAGDYNINVSYSETKNYNGAFNDSINVTVFKASSSVNIIDAAEGVYKTKAPVITVEFENKTVVNYTIVKNNVIISSGDYTNLNTALAGLGVGTYSITITNRGDENHNSSSDSSLFHVLKAASNITIANIAPIVYNTTANVSFNVDNRTVVTYLIKNSLGKIVVKNTTIINNTITVHNLAYGEYTLEIANDENENYTGSFKSALFMITKADNNIELIVDNKVLPGNVDVKVKATVDGVYKVNIGSYSVNVTVQSGEGTCAIAIPAGLNYCATTDFADKENYTVTVKEAIFNVSKGINHVKIEINNTDYPENTVILLTANNKGTYTVDINGTKINMTINKNNGSVSKSILLTPNNYFANITDYFSEDYEAIVTTSNFKVNPGNNTVKVEIDDIKYNETAKVFVTASVKGNYTVNINGTEVIVEVTSNGATGVKTTDKFTKVGKYYANVTSKMQYYTESIT